MIGAVGSIGRLMSTTALRRFLDTLDSLLQALAAQSMRKLYSNYAGACVRVRRSSDGAEMDVGFKLYAFRAYAYWVDEEALLEFAGGASLTVVFWYDQTGQNRHASNTTVAMQPRIVNAGVIVTQNGLPALETFQASQRLIADWNLGGLDGIFASGVFSRAGTLAVTTASLFAGTSHVTGFTPGKIQWRTTITDNRMAGQISSSQTSPASPNVLLNTASVQSVEARVSGIARTYTDGVAGADSAAPFSASPFDTSPMYLLGHPGNTVRGFIGRCSEIVFFGSSDGDALSASERSALIANQGAAFGITVA